MTPSMSAILPEPVDFKQDGSSLAVETPDLVLELAGRQELLRRRPTVGARPEEHLGGG